MNDWDPLELATPDMDRIGEVFDLEDGEDVELLGELLDSVLGEAPEALESLLQAQREGRIDDVGAIAHRLKSSFGNLGYLHASQLFQRIMERVRTGDPVGAQELVGALEAATTSLLQGVQDFRDQL